MKIVTKGKPVVIFNEYSFNFFVNRLKQMKGFFYNEDPVVFKKKNPLHTHGVAEILKVVSLSFGDSKKANITLTDASIIRQDKDDKELIVEILKEIIYFSSVTLKGKVSTYFLLIDDLDVTVISSTYSSIIKKTKPFSKKMVYSDLLEVDADFQALTLSRALKKEIIKKEENGKKTWL